MSRREIRDNRFKIERSVPLDIERIYKAHVEGMNRYADWCMRVIKVVYDRGESGPVVGYQKKGGDGRILDIEGVYELWLVSSVEKG